MSIYPLLEFFENDLFMVCFVKKVGKMTVANALERKVPIIVCSTAPDEMPRGENEARQRFAQGDVVFAVVDGITVLLPRGAKYVMQDKYCRWFFSEKYPVYSKDDWFPDKLPIQYDDNGAIKLLRTKPEKSWVDTRNKTIFRKQRKVNG